MLLETNKGQVALTREGNTITVTRYGVFLAKASVTLLTGLLEGRVPYMVVRDKTNREYRVLAAPCKSGMTPFSVLRVHKNGKTVPVAETGVHGAQLHNLLA